MRRRLGADPAFSGLLIKNPLHADWRVTWVHDHAYTLDELGEYLFAHDTRRDPRREVRGLSRDCDTFDHTRYWAYANVLEFKRKGDTEAAWVEQCRVVAAEYNEANCTPPLTLGEIRKTGTSVGRWTWRRFTENGFARRQAQRGRSGMAMRWAGHVSAEKAKPWEAEGISRATWYRRKAAAGHVQPVQIHRETITISDDSAQALGGGQSAPGRQPLTAEALAALTVSDRLAA
jgi:Replicase family/Primase C terminal 1 (PriCT-1)